MILVLLSACSISPNAPATRKANLEKPIERWFEDSELYRLDRSYAVASWVYSVVADRTYLEDETLCLPLNEKWKEIIVDKSEFAKLTKQGFFAQAWHRTTKDGSAKELIIAYRGTDGADDFLSGNFSFIKSPISSSQFDSALTFRNLVLNQINQNPFFEYDYIVFVGHSLGGGLAQYAQDFTESSRAFAFNSSPNRGRLYSLFEEHISDKFVTRVYEKGEVLRPLRFVLFDADPFNNDFPGGPGMNTRWIDFYKDSLIANHNMKDFSTALTRLAAIAGDSEATEVIEYMRKRQQGEGEPFPTHCSIDGTLKIK